MPPGQHPQNTSANVMNTSNAGSRQPYTSSYSYNNSRYSSNNNSNGRFGYSNSQRDSTPHHESVPLSLTNLYIRGLTPATNDDDLRAMCEKFGTISSTKAIMDKSNNSCKGYGFVDFDSPQAAQRAVEQLVADGVQAQMAKQQEQDPTNLYIANLPPNYTEQMLENELAKFGLVVSTRILRHNDATSRGVGFARMDSKDKCEEIIQALNGGRFEAMSESLPPLLIKQADTGRKTNRKRNEMGFDMNIFQNQQLGLGSHEVMRGVTAIPQMYHTTPYFGGYQPHQPVAPYQYDMNPLTAQMGAMQLGNSHQPNEMYVYNNSSSNSQQQPQYYPSYPPYGANSSNAYEQNHGVSNNNMMYQQTVHEDPYRKGAAQ
ncbi:unnamed protein product [Caenorhabditis auriculariae]|uniref:RRM domain-containing protein n=1 Tax=Caenorhabditis auriculariae TaxID=2777116 RepID=A0A8S1H1D1_9PELO|nr:unnamed protein product [Caenorhabditis auriculariae]